MNSKDDPITLISKPSYKTVVLKMKAPFLNQIFKPCCYQQENAYKLYKWIPNDAKWDITNGKSGKRILKLEESSSCAMRCLVPSSLRGYEGHFQAENSRRVVFNMVRPCKLTILCCARPETHVYVVNPKKSTDIDAQEMQQLNTLNETIPNDAADKIFIGRAALPFSFCGTSITIYDEINQPIYSIYGSAWQCQLCFFSTPSGPCKESMWVIRDYRSNSKEVIGHVYKRWSNCFKMCCSTAPWYIIDFPENIDWKKKLLIISAVQLLDQHYFGGSCQ